LQVRLRTIQNSQTMKTDKQLLLLAIALIFSLSLSAQTDSTAPAAPPEKDKKSLDSGTISSQFDYVIEESNRYQEYKVVKMSWLFALKTHVSDSLHAVRKELAATQNTVSSQQSDVGAMQGLLTTTRDSLADVRAEKNSIEFINVQMSKSSYKTMMWALCAGLFALLLFFIYKFNDSNEVTSQTRQSFSEIQQEFEAFKKRAREKEQVLKRELQDELNKRVA